MLSAKHNLQGMTLVEILVAVAIVAILFAAAAPDFAIWIQNTRIRNAADTIQNGIYLAKSEAVHRNATVQFVSCGGNSVTWDVISASGVAANVNICNNALPTNNWERVQTNSGQNTASNALVDVGQATIAFNGMGRQASTTDLTSGAVTPNPPLAVDINVAVTLAGASCYCPAGNCGYPVAIPYASTGTLRCLRVTVASGGLVRMCDPALGPGTPQGC